MRVVLDTNTVVSGLLWGGPPRHLIDAGRTSQIDLHTSTVLLAELAEVIAREKFAMRIRAAGLSPAALVADYARLARIVSPAQITPAVAGDPDDDQVLACAIAAQADLVVSGDNRVRNLKSFQRVPIVSAAQALALVDAQARNRAGT